VQVEVLAHAYVPVYTQVVVTWSLLALRVVVLDVNRGCSLCLRAGRLDAFEEL
jgi:hypothetical protein